MDSQALEDRLISIEAMLDVLLTLEKQRRAKEYDRPYEQVVIEIDQLLGEARAAAAGRSRHTSSS